MQAGSNYVKKLGSKISLDCPFNEGDIYLNKYIVKRKKLKKETVSNCNKLSRTLLFLKLWSCSAITNPGSEDVVIL